MVACNIISKFTMFRFCATPSYDLKEVKLSIYSLS